MIHNSEDQEHAVDRITRITPITSRSLGVGSGRREGTMRGEGRDSRSEPPWRFDLDAYLDAAAAHPHAGPLIGSPVAAAWDPKLSHAMLAEGRRIEEELVAEQLLEELVVT